MTLGANVLVQSIEAPCSKTCRRAQVEPLRGMRSLEHFQSPLPTPRVRAAHQPTGSSFEDHLNAGSTAFAISPTLRIYAGGRYRPKAGSVGNMGTAVVSKSENGFEHSEKRRYDFNSCV